mmetsp:Transcript_132916/g.315004  ORF Transcript_132916/g.315004 Transcript_132916/m.315004 type:complete len:220 (-) Transcript_132916:353-1012(-)
MRKKPEHLGGDPALLGAEILHWLAWMELRRRPRRQAQVAHEDRGLHGMAVMSLIQHHHLLALHLDQGIGTLLIVLAAHKLEHMIHHGIHTVLHDLRHLAAHSEGAIANVAATSQKPREAVDPRGPLLPIAQVIAELRGKGAAVVRQEIIVRAPPFGAHVLQDCCHLVHILLGVAQWNATSVVVAFGCPWGVANDTSLPIGPLAAEDLHARVEGSSYAHL